MDANNDEIHEENPKKNSGKLPRIKPVEKTDKRAPKINKKQLPKTAAVTPKRNDNTREESMPQNNDIANKKSFCAPWEIQKLDRQKKKGHKFNENLDKSDQNSAEKSAELDGIQRQGLALPPITSRPRSKSVAPKQKPRNNFFIEPNDDSILPPLSATGSMTSRQSQRAGAPARWPGSDMKIPRQFKHMEDDFGIFFSFPHTESVMSLRASDKVRVSSLPSGYTQERMALQSARMLYNSPITCMTWALSCTFEKTRCSKKR